MNSTKVKINLQKAWINTNTGGGAPGGTYKQGRTAPRRTGPISADKGNADDLQSEDNQGCQHCSLHQPSGVSATTERNASRREEETGRQRTLLEVGSFE